MLHENQAPKVKPGANTGELVARVDGLLKMKPKPTVEGACEVVGIPKETYYWHKRKEREVAAAKEAEAA